MIYLPGWPILPLSPEDQKVLAEALANPREPSPQLRAAAAGYTALHRDAARYRWLRANPIMAETMFNHVMQQPAKDTLAQVDLLVDDALSFDEGLPEATDGRTPGD